MKSLSAVLSFVPVRLPEARAKVVKIHPRRVTPRNHVTPAELTLLRKRVAEAAAAPDPDRALDRLAWELRRREVIAVVRSIGEWPELRDAVATVAFTRPLADYTLALWRVWQSFPQVALIVNLLASMARRFGFNRAVGGPYADAAEGWFSDPHPIDALVGWCDREEVAWDRLPALPESPFRSETPLITQVFHRTLQIGSSSQLRAMTEETILDGWMQMSGEPRMDACANLLRRIEPGLWEYRDTLLEEIRESYGIPPKPDLRRRSVAESRRSLSAFWDRLSVQRREEFRQYFIRKELDLAFRGDSTPDRRDFWMAQRHDITGVSHGTAGTGSTATDWSLIDFPGFSVVEFFAYANAAYLYPEDHPIILRIESGERFVSPGDLKSRGENNRIIHRSGWQSEAEWKLHTWKARYS